MNQENPQKFDLEQLIKEPVCTDSEFMWLKFLIFLSQTTPEVRATMPKPTVFRVYDRTTKQTYENVTGIRKRDLEQCFFGKKTILCLTGALAGAICVSLYESPDILEEWDINPDYIDADVVALRMMRSGFPLILDAKYYLEQKFQVSIGDADPNWFYEKLEELLTELDWEHDSAQMRANAVNTHSTLEVI